MPTLPVWRIHSGRKFSRQNYERNDRKADNRANKQAEEECEMQIAVSKL